MKKLMVAAVAVGMAICANAYTVTWGLTPDSVVDRTGEEFTSGTALIYALSASDKAISFSDGAWNLNGAQLVDTAAFDDGSWANWDGKTSSVSTLGGDPSYFQIILTQDTGITDISTYLGDGKYYTMAYTGAGDTVKSADPSHAGEIVGYELFAGDGITIAKGDWVQASAVPEPTSGILLLLGIAGLALKRKRS